MIWIPKLSSELVIHTSNDIVEDEATNVKKELFSNDPQNSVVNSGHESDVYEADVFPQYPFKLQIGVATAHVLPAAVFVIQLGGGTGVPIHKVNAVV